MINNNVKKCFSLLKLCFFSSEMGHFFLLLFLLKPAGRTGTCSKGYLIQQYTMDSDTIHDLQRGRLRGWSFPCLSHQLENERAFSSHGKVRDFFQQNGKAREFYTGKAREICQSDDVGWFLLGRKHDKGNRVIMALSLHQRWSWLQMSADPPWLRVVHQTPFPQPWRNLDFEILPGTRQTKQKHYLTGLYLYLGCIENGANRDLNLVSQIMKCSWFLRSPRDYKF